MDKTALRPTLIDRLAALPFAARALLAFAAGATTVPAMPPGSLWFCMIPGFGLFYLLLAAEPRLRGAMLLGWLYGFGYFLFGVGWIANALLVEGNDYAWAWPLAAVGLPALLAAFPALAALAARRFGGLDLLTGYLFFCVALAGTEWLRGHVFTGFPWNLFAYGWATTLPLAQLAAVFGAYGLGLLTILWLALPGFLLAWKARRAIRILTLAAGLATLGAAFAYGKSRLANNAPDINPAVVVRLVQPNIPQADKWDPRKARQNLEQLLTLSTPGALNEHVPTLIVWPETAITEHVLRDDTARALIRTVLGGYGAPAVLLTGVMRFEDTAGGRRYFNSLGAYDPGLNRLGVFDKSHLVPFGEYIPMQRWIPLRPVASFTGFTPGRGATTQSLPHGLGRFGPLICYEVIFPGNVANRDDRPHYLVNVTNDSWYGDSAGPRQHFAKAQFRAIEEGLPVIRSANTGISGVIDSLGRTLYKTRLDTAAGDNVVLPRPLPAAPPYARFGDLVFAAALALLAGLSLALRVRRNYP